MTLQKKQNVAAYAVVIPIVAYILLFLLVPLYLVFYYSFTDEGIKRETDFVGFKNYIDIFKYAEYFDSIKTTLIMAVILTVGGLFIGFLLACLVKTITGKKRSVVLAIWYLPVLISMAVVSQFVKLLISPTGTINRIIESLGGEAIIFTESTFWMYFFIIFVSLWKGTGGTILFMLAGMTAIDQSVYEAADIDGANKWQKILFITLPLTRPMIGYCLITGFIGNMGIFEQVQLISNGGPNSTTKVIMFRIYDEAFSNFKYGFACALSVVIGIIIFIFTCINLWITDGSIFKAEKQRGKNA